MSENPERPHTFEIVLREGFSEEELLRALDRNGFEIRSNYTFLPRNFCVQDVSGRTVAEALAVLETMPECEDDPLPGDTQVIHGDEVLRSTFLEDMDRTAGYLGDRRPVSKQGIGFFPWTSFFGRNWGVHRTLLEELLPGPFNWPNPGVYETDFFLNGNGVDYYILDSGVDPDHEEFNLFEYGYRVIDVYDSFYQTGEDDQNHGTGMASTGAGRSMGIAQNCRVFTAKGFDGNNSGSLSALAAGMNALVGAFIAEAPSGRPGVMNNSWSGSLNSSITSAKNAAIDAGMVVVASAGNGSSSSANQYPAAYSDVISVGALDLDFRRADFSNFGSWIDLYSPGRDMIQGGRGDTVRWGDGTSPAGAYVTAIVCCLLQGYSRPAGRTEVLAIRDFVRDLCQNARRYDGNLTENQNTTQRVVRIPPRPQFLLPRIPGLANMIAPRRSGLGGSILTRSCVRQGGVGPTRSPASHPNRSERFEALTIGQPSPSSQTGGDGLLPWQGRNHGFIAANISADPRRMFASINHGSQTDGDGDSLAIPGRPGTDFSFIPGTDAATGLFYQTIPIRMVPESNPISLFDVFQNMTFGTGDLTGWTQAGPGTPRVVNANGTFFPYVGAWMWEATGGANSSITQTRDLPVAFSAEKVDAGLLRLFFEVHVGTTFADDDGARISIVADDDGARISIVAVDGADADISTIFDTGPVFHNASPTWNLPGRFQITDAVVPPGTRKLRLRVEAIFAGGTVVNGPVSGLAGWLYEDTTEGQRVMEHVRRGKARLLWEMVHRSLNVQTDDQGRQEIEFFNQSGGRIGAVETDGYRSPHNWTVHTIRRMIPEEAVSMRLAIRGNRRAGAVNNYYTRDHRLEVRFGDFSRRIASKQGQTVRGGGPRVATTGFQTGVRLTSTF